MIILAIDPANNLGWASLIGKDLSKIKSGVVELKGKHDVSDERLVRLKDFLNRKNEELGGIGLIAFEKPVAFKLSKRNPFAVAELAAVIKLWCQVRKVKYIDVSPPTLKKFVSGNGRASKEDMIRSVNDKFGKKITVHDEADAVAVLYWTYSLMEENSCRE